MPDLAGDTLQQVGSAAACSTGQGRMARISQELSVTVTAHERVLAYLPRMSGAPLGPMLMRVGSTVISSG